MLLLSTLIACPAEQLGVELPRGGEGTISQEDLQRDVHAILGEAPAAIVVRRMEQMHVDAVVEGAGSVCARHDGKGAARVVVAPWPVDVDTAATAAVLISLAKGWDGNPPPRTTWLCTARAEATLPDGERVDLAPMTSARQMEAIDYRLLQSDVAALFVRLDGP